MESLNEENFGGYDAYFINELLDEHECPVCKMALRKPIQTLCGHRLCLSCAEEMRKRNKGVLICPLDNSILDSSKIFPDTAIERVIMQLKVKCNNFSNGCEWTGELKILNEHLGSCKYQTLKCLNKPCSTSLLLKNLKEHMENLCIYRLVTCQYCKQKIILSEKQIHEKNCECLPLCCVNQCGMKIMRKEGMRKEHETHANSLMQNHLSMAISKLDALENKITLTVDTLENKIASKVNALENKIMLKVDALENKITSKVESFENKNASEVVALENKITSTVDALKNELISKVDAQKDEILLHEKNLEIIKAFLAVKTAEFVTFHDSIESLNWHPTDTTRCNSFSGCLNLYLLEFHDECWFGFYPDCTRNDFLRHLHHTLTRSTNELLKENKQFLQPLLRTRKLSINLYHGNGSIYDTLARIQKKLKN
ncbi:TNF receptor-associated factor 5-like isoform X2 [Hydra vulgaris]|uniref:TNF receptor-associated factor 5-like isoform X2 n=1 Tax=Hydra vulgaris TaxID=6087 RepID=A0ABM4CE76_HYDVU